MFIQVKVPFLFINVKREMDNSTRFLKNNTLDNIFSVFLLRKELHPIILTRKQSGSKMNAGELEMLECYRSVMLTLRASDNFWSPGTTIKLKE